MIYKLIKWQKSTTSDCVVATKSQIFTADVLKPTVLEDFGLFIFFFWCY